MGEKLQGTVLVGFSVNAELNSFVDPDDIRELHRSTVEVGVNIVKRVMTFDHLAISVSGSSRNVGSALVRAGHSDVKVMGTIGSDIFGNFIVQQLIAEGQDFTPLQARTRTNLSINTTSKGEDPGVLNQNFKAEYLQDQIPIVAERVQQEVRRIRPIYRIATGVQVADAPLAEAMFGSIDASDGVPASTNIINLGATLLCPSYTPENEHERERWLKKVLRRADILAINRTELRELLTGLKIIPTTNGNGMDLPAVDELRAKVQNEGLHLLITCGGDGALYYEPGNGEMNVNAFPVTKVVDPTGAGDCFLGTFIARTIAGEDRNEALVHAAAASALSVQKLGGDSSPTLEETLDFRNLVETIRIPKVDRPLCVQG